MKDFRSLLVWQKSHDLALKIYRATSEFPKTELYGLTSQLRRAVVSIPSNIAEGCGRGSEADFARFLQLSMGSASEVEYQILLGKDLALLSETEYFRLNSAIVEVKRMLSSLIAKIRKG
ncbi:four helix bundle protein [Telmatocola sphagniphila]|jgi:four helix bundle protein|uniref:Four helix bundle protein n=1 Tax=Telmatocola sphagniphila TaxID=1123043 RepID=A0A8E6B6Y6_9BACT|nr:four helix bundle protein [Telmatocola sphagniphila]QVL31535.1 four helix bundle protein [Telmatocola sphagniphila]